MVMAPGGINDPSFISNPYPFYEMGRKLSPMPMPGMGGFMAFNWDECNAILRDNDSWPSGFMGASSGSTAGLSMLTANPPRHTRLRALVSQAFTPRMVELMTPRFREIAAELLDPIIESV